MKEIEQQNNLNTNIFHPLPFRKKITNESPEEGPILHRSISSISKNNPAQEFELKKNASQHSYLSNAKNGNIYSDLLQLEFNINKNITNSSKSIDEEKKNKN